MLHHDAARQIAENLADVRQRIADAAKRSGRSSDAITLVGVTKYVDSEVAACLVEAGCETLGESRPQEMRRKAEALQSQPVRWHLIGHLQRNKIRQILPIVSLIHSVDSWRLLEAIDKQSASLPEPTELLLEVNISGDESKHGLRPDDVPSVAERASGLPHVRVCGLMAMAGIHSDADQTRREFAALRELRDRARGDADALPHLSMGMSRDFEIAVEEGATLVRVGSALYKGLEQ